MNLYLDIETIPSQSPAVHARIAETVTHPGNITKAESIAAWEADKKPALVKEAIAKTSFDGAYGHVLCIGWAIDDAEPSIQYMNSGEKSIEYAEAGALQEFVYRVEHQVGQYHQPTIVGHNVCNFDIRFLWQRAIVLGVKMPAWFPRDPKPWGHDTFDTMTAFAGQRGTIGMDRLCEALGMEGKGEIDGSMVAALWAKGEHQKIAEYCKADVERVRAIHRRMQVAFGEMAA